MRIHPEWLTDDIRIIILVDSVASMDMEPHPIDITIIGIVVLSLSIFKKMKIGIIFCHVINHPIPSRLKYLPTFTSQKCIGAIPIFIIIEMRIRAPPLRVAISLLVILIVVMYINRRIEAIV